MSSLDDQLNTRMPRRPVTTPAEKIDELVARTSTPVPRRIPADAAAYAAADRRRAGPPEISPSVMKEIEIDAEPGPARRRRPAKTKTTFGLTEEALRAKVGAQHWCLDNGVPLDSVVSALLVLFVQSETIREAIRSSLDA